MANQEITGLQIQIELDDEGVQASGVRLEARAKKIAEAFNLISGLKTDQKLQEIQKAVEKLGGVANLSSPQIATLRGELDKLAKAGASIPKSLKLPAIDTSSLKNIGAAINTQALSGIQSQVSTSLGPLGGILTAIGPAGLAAGAGIAVVGGAMGAAAVTAIELVKGLSETAARLSDIAAKTQLSTGFLQEIEHAGKQVGVSLDEISGAAVKLSQKIGEGDEIFQKLGLSLAELQASNPDDQFRAVAEAIARIPDPATQAAAAIQAFGKSGAQLLPLIRSDMAGAAEEARRLGIVLGTDLVKSGDTLDDTLTTINEQLKALKDVIGAEFVKGGGLNEAIRGLGEGLAGLIKIMPATLGYLREFADLIPGLNQIATLTGAGIGKVQEIGRFAGVKAPDQAELDKIRNAPQTSLATDLGLDADFQNKLKQITEDHKKAAAEAEKAQRAEEAYFKAVGDGVAKSLDSFSKLRAAREERAAQQDVSLGGSKAAQFESEKIQAAIVDVGGVAELTAKQVEFLAQKFFDLSKAGADIPQDLGAISEQANKLNFDAAAASMAEAENAAVEFQKTLAGFGLIPGFTPESIDAVFGRIPEEVDKAKTATYDWHKALQDVANLAQTLPGVFGKAIGGIVSGVQGIGSSLKNIGGFSGLKDSFSKGIGGVFASLGTIGTIVGSGVGIAKSIIGLFKKDPVKQAQKEIGKALGHGVSKEFAEQVKKEAEATGKSLAEVAKHLEAQTKFQASSDRFQQRTEGIQHAIGGLDAFGKIKGAAAAQGRIFTATFWGAVNQLGLPAAVQAFKATFDKLKAESPAMVAPLAHIFDVFSEGAAADAAEGAKGLSDVLAGLATSGYLTQQTFADFGASAKAAFDQASTSGASTQEALLAIAPLLGNIERIQQETGLQVDATTQALLDQAHAAGIAFPVDPMLAVLDVLKEILAALTGIPSAARDAASSIATIPKPPSPGDVHVPPGGGSPPGHALGGLVNYPSRGRLAVLHGRELILPLNNAQRTDQLLRTYLGISARVASFASGGFLTGPGANLAAGATTDTGGFGGAFAGAAGTGGSISISAPVTISVQVEAMGDTQAIGDSVASSIDAEVPVIMDALARTIRREIAR